MLERYTSDKELLIKALSRLSEDYRKAKSGTETNPLRKKQIQLLQTLSTHTHSNAHEILLGACHFVAQAIEAEYSGWVWPLNNPKNSALYRLIQEVLDEADLHGKASPQHTCIYLIQFVNYLQQQKLFPELQQSAIDCAKKAKQHIQPIIQSLLKRPPTLVAMKQQFDALPPSYEEHCSHDSRFSKALAYVGLGGRDTKRKQAIELAKILIAKSNATQPGTADEADTATEEDYLLRYGAMLYIMTQIESQYSVLSPDGGWITNGSQLYKLCQKVTNISRTTELGKEFVKADLSRLFMFIASQSAEKGQKEEWQKMHGLNLGRIQDEITDQLSELKNSRTPLVNNPTHNSLLNRFCSTVAQTTAQLGVGYGLAQLVKGMLFADISLTTLFTAATPQYAFLILGLVWLQNQFKSQCLATIAYPVVPAIEGLCRTVIRAPIELCAPGQGLFSSQPSPINSSELELLKALNSAPDHVFSAKEKLVLKHVFNLEHEKTRIEEENRAAETRMLDGWDAIRSCDL